MYPEHADKIANSVDTDQEQSDLKEQSDLGLHYLSMPVCLKTYNHNSTLFTVRSTYYVL